MQDTTEQIPNDGRVRLFKKNGKTADIIKAIQAGDAESIAYVLDFAPSMKGADIAQTCYNLYNFVTNTIPYKEDPEGKQYIQLPGELYRNRYKHLLGTGEGGDCKSMTLFCSSVLRALGIYDFRYAFTANNAADDVHHVYLEVDYTGPDGEAVYIPLDCTLPNFGVEANYSKKIHMQPHLPVSGIGATYTDAVTVSENEASVWEYTNNQLQKNFWSWAQALRERCMKNVFDTHKSRPIKYSEFQKALLKNWVSFLDGANICLYYYWNDKAMMAYSLCQLSPTNPQDIPFPADYARKIGTARKLVEAFRMLGITDANIRTLVDLSTYRTYGVGMEYMLYRCYCIELYGQPFKPYEGIPYWNNQTGTLVANGAPLTTVVNIALCFPAQGGISRPFGQPYWSTGNNVIANGAKNEVVENWIKSNPAPGTPIGGDPNNRVPGTIMASLSLQRQNECLIDYNRWCNGNMVMLHQPVIVGQKDRIGYGTGEIVGIVVAVISAVVAVITTVAKLIEVFKEPQSSADIALPMEDFRWDYQTSDGCIIGHCAQLGGCNSAQIVKMCNGKIVEVNPDTTQPQNQPAAPGNAFTGTPPQTKRNLLIGASLLALGGGVLLLNSDSTE